MLPVLNEETINGSRTSAAFEGINEATQANIRRNGSDISNASINANDGSKSKRKHVVRIVARRTLPCRSSLSASENGNDAPELPHMAFAKDRRTANSLPYLEPAEMLECETSLLKSFYDYITWYLSNQSHALPQLLQRHLIRAVLYTVVWDNYSILHVPVKQICHTPPQKYTNTGTFVVDLRGFANRHEIALDGLGAWGRPQGSSRYCKFVGAIPVKVQGVDGSEVKVLCNRYEHPGTTAERGRFIRKIMAGVSTSLGTPLPLAVVVYEWLGEPHPIQLRNMEAVEASRRPYGSRNWELRWPAEVVGR